MVRSNEEDGRSERPDVVIATSCSASPAPSSIRSFTGVTTTCAVALVRPAAMVSVTGWVAAKSTPSCAPPATPSRSSTTATGAAAGEPSSSPVTVICVRLLPSGAMSVESRSMIAVDGTSSSVTVTETCGASTSP